MESGVPEWCFEGKVFCWVPPESLPATIFVMVVFVYESTAASHNPTFPYKLHQTPGMLSV